MSIFPEFKLTGVYLDIIELELYPARLPHFATLPLQSVCESVRESATEIEGGRLKIVKTEYVKYTGVVCSLIWFETWSIWLTIDVRRSRCFSHLGLCVVSIMIHLHLSTARSTLISNAFLKQNFNDFTQSCCL